MIAALLTIVIMVLGLAFTILCRYQSKLSRHQCHGIIISLAYHMHLVAVMLPIEAIVTLSFWLMFFFQKDAIISPEAKALGY